MPLNFVSTIGKIPFDMTGEQLKEIREKLGLSQTELAERLRVARNTVWRWEQGKRHIPEFLDLALETIERRIKEQSH